MCENKNALLPFVSQSWLHEVYLDQYLFDYYRFYYHLEKRTNDGCWIALADIRLNMYKVEKYMMFCFAFIFSSLIIYLTIQ